MNYVFFDIECANCFQGRGKICSFGYVITDEFFNVLKKEDIIINPRSKFHLIGHGNHPGIVLAYDEKTFKSSPSFPSFYTKIRSLLEDPNNLIFGFSVMSDAGYIKSECQRYNKEIFDYKFIDVQRIYADMHELTDTPSLIKCAAHYGVTQTQDVHKSDDDALFTMQVMKGLCEDASMSAFELIDRYENCKCWCENGELDSQYAVYKARLRASKLSKMEKATNTKRSNWMNSDTNNSSEFLKYISRVFIHYSHGGPLSGKRVCISSLYEDFHFAEMMNIVSTLAQHGVKYTTKPYNCDIFVTYSLKNKNGESYECYRLKKALRLNESREQQIQFIPFEVFLKDLELDESEISVLDRSKLSFMRKRIPSGT